jgi:hypothetical protein
LVIILSLLVLPFIVIAAPLIPAIAVNDSIRACFTYTPGDECGNAILPDGWERLDGGSRCPMGYSMLSQDETPPLKIGAITQTSDAMKRFCGQTEQDSKKYRYVLLGLICFPPLLWHILKNRKSLISMRRSDSTSDI